MPCCLSKRTALSSKKRYGDLQGEYGCGMLCDLLHSEGAEVIAEYGDDFYKGMPVVTRNTFGQGEAWYVASDPDERFLDGLLGQLAAAKNVESLLETPEGVEVSARTKDGKPYLFVMNHNATTQSYDLGTAKAHDLLTNRELSGSVEIEARGFSSGSLLSAASTWACTSGLPVRAKATIN